jgi:hypothetical protein
MGAFTAMRAGISAAVADPAKAMAEVASKNRFMTVPRSAPLKAEL